MTIIPKPVKFKFKDGFFTITPETVISASGKAAGVAQYLARKLAPATGMWLKLKKKAGKDGAIVFKLDKTLTALGDEGYRLTVTPEKVTLEALKPAGLFYACQSLLQLLPPAIFRSAPVAEVGWTIPAARIIDYPRFAWRGAMLDCCRHFMPKEFVKKFIDLLALHKMNVFHWHLTEDQGWRIEIKKFPRLTGVGAWRKQTIIGHLDHVDKKRKYDGIPHGGFYTQDDIREVVAYARERFVNIVPEIELPGHAQAAIAAYPELGNTGKQLEVSTKWGISENVYNAEESTIRFLQDVLDETLALFPSEFIHIGGDEVPKIQWKESPAAQARMQEFGLKTEEELQSYIVRRMDDFLTSRKRRLIGWDEILEGGLAPNATVMSWRGIEGGIAAAKAGHDVVMAPNQFLYLDYCQSEDRDNEPLAIGGFLPLKTVYSYEPIPAELTPKEARHILGAQGQLWAEYIPNAKHAEYMGFPRYCAVSEVTWSPAESKDYPDFLQRLSLHLERLNALDVAYRPLSKD